MSTQPKKASDEQIAMLRKWRDLWNQSTWWDTSIKGQAPDHGAALTTVLDELEQYRKGAAKQPTATTVASYPAIQVCPTCDIENCRHIRAKQPVTSEQALINKIVDDANRHSPRTNTPGKPKINCGWCNGTGSISIGGQCDIACKHCAGVEQPEKICEWEQLSNAANGLKRFRTSCRRTFYWQHLNDFCEFCGGKIVEKEGE